MTRWEPLQSGKIGTNRPQLEKCPEISSSFTITPKAHPHWEKQNLKAKSPSPVDIKLEIPSHIEQDIFHTQWYLSSIKSALAKNLRHGSVRQGCHHYLKPETVLGQPRMLVKTPCVNLL